MADDYRNTYNGVGTLGSLTDGGSVGGVVDTGGDHDLFSIALVEGRTYRFNLQGAGGFPNTSLTLRDGAGIYVDSQLGFSGTAATMLYTAAASGTFYLDAGSAYSEQGGSFTLSSVPSFVDDYRDTTTATNEPIGTIASGQTKSGSIEAQADKDIFNATLTAGVTYTITLHGTTLVNKQITLLNSGGSYVEAVSGFGLNGDAVLNFTAPTTGAYFLQLASAYSEQLGNYTIRVSDPFVDDYRDTYNDSSETLGSVAPGGTTSGKLEIDGDKDVFAISLVAGTTYTITANGAGASPLATTSLTVLDSTGLYQIGNTGFGGTAATVNLTANATGTFYIDVRGGSSTNKGTYSLSVSNGITDDYRDTINDTSEPLGSIAPGTSKNGYLETEDDTDVFAMTLNAGSLYTIEAKRIGSDLDGNTITLFDKNGVIIDTESGYGSDGARISYSVTETGAYYVRATGTENLATGGYNLTLSGPQPIADDFRNIYNSAGKPLGSVNVNGGYSTGRIESAGDKDVFKVTLEVGNSYTVDLIGRNADEFSALPDPELRVLNSKGKQVAINDDFNGDDSRVVFAPTKSGSYYIEASSSPDNGAGGYGITVHKNYDDVRDSTKDKTSPSLVVPVDGLVWGDLETGGDKDVITVTVPGGHCYTIDLVGRGGTPLLDPSLRLLDPKGKPIFENDDYNDLNPRIVIQAPPEGGTYYIEVGCKSKTGKGGYELSVKSDYDDVRDSLTDVSSPASNLVKDVWRYAHLETSGDNDVHSVVLEKGKSYTFDLERSATGGAAVGNPELSLLDDTGAVLGTNNDFNGANSRLVFVPTVTGTYHLDAHASPSSGTGGYRLRMREGFDDFADSITDPASPMGKLKLNKAVMGAIETRGDDDFFQFKLTKGKTYEVTVTGGPDGSQLQDPDMHILDANGTQLAYIDDENGLDPSFLFTVSKTGTYYLDVGGVKSDIGNYTVEWHAIV